MTPRPAIRALALALLLATGAAAQPGATAQPAAKASLAAKAQLADEARFHELAGKIRCLVCQNQSLAESNAALAIDLRRELREHIAAGRSDREILKFMVERYGDFVIYQPPFKATTALLWLGPFALLGVAIAVVIVRIRRRRGARAEPELAPDEQRLVDEVLDGHTDGGKRP